MTAFRRSGEIVLCGQIVAFVMRPVSDGDPEFGRDVHQSPDVAIDISQRREGIDSGSRVQEGNLQVLATAGQNDRGKAHV